MLLWLSNLKKAATGTVSGAKNCLDVTIQSSATLPVIFSPGVIKETRYHDASGTTINASGGTWVQVGGASALANTIISMKVSNNQGESLGIRKAATAIAAAALSDDNATVGPGQSADFPVSFVSGDKLWVLSKTSNSVTSGILILNLVG